MIKLKRGGNTYLQKEPKYSLVFVLMKSNFSSSYKSYFYCFMLEIECKKLQSKKPMISIIRCNCYFDCM